MRQRNALVVVTLTVALVAAAALGQETATPAEPHRTKDEAIRELVGLTGAADIGRQAMDQMRPALQKAMPDLPNEFWDDFMADIKGEEMVDLIVPIYSRHFDLDEIEAIIAFNKTPVGQKVIKEMPIILKESMAAGQEWGRKIGERAYRKAQERKSKAEGGEK